MTVDTLTHDRSALVFIVSIAVCWSLEAWQRRPAQPVPGRRSRNLAINIVTLVLAGLGGAGAAVAADYAASLGWGLSSFSGWPPWLRFALGLLAIDCVDYWRHRLSHEIAPVWLLHRLHHSDPDVDATTSLRNHPLESVMRGAVFAAAALVVGIPVESFAAHTVLQLPVQVFQHARIRLPETMDRLLRLFIVTPAWHLVHHSQDRIQTDSNYATLFTVWDRLFGSAGSLVPPRTLGLADFARPYDRTLGGMLMNPWLEAGLHPDES